MRWPSFTGLQWCYRSTIWVHRILNDSERMSLDHIYVVGMLRFMSDINQPSLPAPFYSVLVSVSVFMEKGTKNILFKNNLFKKDYSYKICGPVITHLPVMFLFSTTILELVSSTRLCFALLICNHPLETTHPWLSWLQVCIHGVRQNHSRA